MSDDYETHPAYGVVGFYRTSGNPGKMFGSALPQHGHFVHLSIKRAKRKHSLGQDWIMADSRLPLVDVWLSAAQFSELLTTMNIGDGVPCTIRAFNGETMPPVPEDEQTEAERTYQAGREKMAVFGDELKAEIAAVRGALLAKGSISVAQRREVAALLDKVLRETGENMPFALRCFQEAVEKTSTQAKAELDAVITHAVTSKGLEALGVEPRVLELEEGGETE